MATVRKSIEIDVKADMKRLLTEFKKIPNMSKDEAKKMVSNLTHQLKRAELAAKKTAKATQKAGNDMANGFRVAEKQARSLRSQARNLNRTMSGLEDAVGLINPELEIMTSQFTLAAQGSRALMNGLASGNPIIIGLTVAITAAVAAYTLFSRSSEDAKKNQETLSSSIEETSRQMQELKQKSDEATAAMNNNSLAVNETVFQYMLMSGAISKTEGAQLKMEKSIGDMESKISESGKERIKAEESRLHMLKMRLQANKLLESSFEKQDQLFERRAGQLRLTELGVNLRKEQARITSEILQIESNIEEVRKDTAAQVENQSKQYREAFSGIQRLRKEEEQRQKAQRAREKAQNEAKKRMSQLDEISLNLQDQSAQIQDSIRQKEIQRLDPKAKINALFDEEIKKLNELERNSQVQLNNAENIAKLKKEDSKVDEIKLERAKLLGDIEEKRDQLKAERIQELAELEQKIQEEQDKLQDKRDEKREKASQRLNRQFQASLDSSLRGLAQFATSGQQLIQNLGVQNKGLITALFRAQQAFAIADIVMSTARAIARAPADYGPFAGLAIPAIAAGGAAQIAVVASQAPPEMHMGGMVKGDDTQTITALSGEAVLDRRTVNRLGGEQGVNQLQRGKTQQEQIVVIQPYKHFDRYVNFNKKRGGSLAKLAPKNPQGAY